MMSIAGEKPLNVNAVDALAAEPAEGRTVGLDASQLRKVRDAVERQQRARDSQLHVAQPSPYAVWKESFEEGNHRLNTRILAQQAYHHQHCQAIADLPSRTDRRA